MIMNIIVSILVLSIGYAWLNRGIFSAMLHTICVLVSGAIAFALWEPVSIMLVNASPERGFFSFIESAAWGAGLVLPFGITLLVLRVIADKLIPSNIKNNAVFDRLGGLAFGLASGIVSIGILVIGVGNLRLPTDFLGYQPLWYSTDRANGAGSLVKSDSLWLPVDKVVTNIYGTLSVGAMSTDQPLRYWYPELHLTGFASRLSPMGAARNTVRPDDFRVTGTFTVGPENGSVSELLKLGDGSTQRYVDIDNETVGNGQIFGYVVEFEPGAKERGEKGAGQLIISNGQVRLLVENSDGSTSTVFPMAVISESNTPGLFGRWRFDANDVFISSTGGSSKVPMGFEFVVPTGSTPVALFVKNIRVQTADLPEPVNYKTPSRRDLSVRTGNILKGKSDQAEYDTENMIVFNTDEQDVITKSDRLPEVMALSVARRGLTLNSENRVVDGEGAFLSDEVGRSHAPVSKKLRAEYYALGNNQTLIKVNVGPDSPFGFLSPAMQIAPLDEPIKLIDTRGNEYEAIGYEYRDSKGLTIRYTRGSTLGGVQDTPTLSSTRVDQKLTLLFIVTKGVEIKRYVIGDMVYAEFSPPVQTN